MLFSLAEKLNRPALLEYVRRILNFCFILSTPTVKQRPSFRITKAERTVCPQAIAYGKICQLSIITATTQTAADLTLSTYLRSINNGLIRPNVNNPNRYFKGEGISRFFMTADIGELLSIESERNNDWITRIPLPRQYERKYTQSNIARIQRDQTSLTIIGDKQILFALRNGQAIIDGFRIKYIYHGFEIIHRQD